MSENIANVNATTKESIFDYTPFRTFVANNGGEITIVNTKNNNKNLLIGGVFVSVKDELKPNLTDLVKTQSELLVVGTTKTVDKWGKHGNALFMQGGLTIIESFSL